MKGEQHMPISDEQLNAYIDDELDFETRTRVFEQLSQDESLTREAQELRQLRSQLRHAYRNPPLAPRPDRVQPGARHPLKGLAACLLLSIGVITGWHGKALFTGSEQLAGVAQLNTAVASKANLLLHISSSDPTRMAVLLELAEERLATSREQGNTFRIEVVANDGGVELLRRDTSPFPERITALLTEYDNISFLACANALRKLRNRGIKVELLPGIRSDETAIDAIIERIEGGWRYIKV